MPLPIAGVWNLAIFMRSIPTQTILEFYDSVWFCIWRAVFFSPNGSPDESISLGYSTEVFVSSLKIWQWDTWHSKKVEKMCELHIKQGQDFPGIYVCAKIFLLFSFVVSPVKYLGSGDTPWLAIWVVMAGWAMFKQTSGPSDLWDIKNVQYFCIFLIIQL